MAIDPTARVADGARIADSVEIGPYCLVGPQVELARGVRLIAHVNVTGATTIGEDTIVYPFLVARNAAAIGAIIAAAQPNSSSARTATCARA